LADSDDEAAEGDAEGQADQGNTKKSQKDSSSPATDSDGKSKGTSVGPSADEADQQANDTQSGGETNDGFNTASRDRYDVGTESTASVKSNDSIYSRSGPVTSECPSARIARASHLDDEDVSGKYFARRVSVPDDALAANSAPSSFVGKSKAQSKLSPGNESKTGSAAKGNVYSVSVATSKDVTSGPVAAAGDRWLTLKIVLLPTMISAAIFALLWSVISGWFERLIY
jgi:hypothetical protein